MFNLCWRVECRCSHRIRKNRTKLVPEQSIPSAWRSHPYEWALQRVLAAAKPTRKGSLRCWIECGGDDKWLNWEYANTLMHAATMLFNWTKIDDIKHAASVWSFIRFIWMGFSFYFSLPFFVASFLKSVHISNLNVNASGGSSRAFPIWHDLCAMGDVWAERFQLMDGGCWAAYEFTLEN